MSPSRLTLSQHRSRRLFFSGAYHVLAGAAMVVIAIELLSGSNDFILYLQNDLLPVYGKTLFVLGLPTAYFLSLVIVLRSSPLPSFDFYNRIVVVTLTCFSLYGFILALSRIGIFSRTLFVIEAGTTAILLLGYLSLRLRWFPPLVGIPISIQNDFAQYRNIRWVPYDPLLPPENDLDIIVLDESADTTSEYPAPSLLFRSRTQVTTKTEIHELLSGRVVLSDMTATLLTKLRPPRLYFAIKRTGELMLSLLFSPVVLTFCFVFGVLVKIDSPGPIFFRQKRVGLNGHHFSILKLRTMSHDNARSGRDRFADPDDYRITRVGRWLRNYRLDELPQFWNILRGEMSLIGPRPEQPSFVDHFKRTIPLYPIRHAVRPGITGWAQVRYGYAASEEQTRTKLEYDLFYIKHMSIWLDFNILLSTLATVLSRRGAR